jgi:hypothetical protein
VTQSTGTVNRTIPGTDLNVFPLALGGNVFSWTADEAASFEVLDAYVAGGGNFIETADVHSASVPGHSGGESELVIGRWMAERGNRLTLLRHALPPVELAHQDGSGSQRGLSVKLDDCPGRRGGTARSSPRVHCRQIRH